MHIQSRPLISSKLQNWLLGTAQFGMDYGITNVKGKTSQDEAWVMILEALLNGAIGVDTAVGYGDAEQVLAIQPYTAKITTKISCFGKGSIRQQVENSLCRVNCQHIDTILIHDCKNLTNPKILNAVRHEFEELKEKKLVSSVGVSVYEVEQTQELLEQWIPDVVQIPLNPLNQSFLTSGELSRLKSNGVRIQARSLFLQGVLLSEQLPERLASMADIFVEWQQFFQAQEISAMSACKSFAISQQEVDHWVLGFENEAQLGHFISEPAYELPAFDCSVADLDRVNPSKW